MGTVASGCHRGVGRVLGRNICSREHRGSKPGAGMNPHEYLQPSVICALSCFRQEPSKDPELPRGEGTSPFSFFLLFIKLFRLQHQPCALSHDFQCPVHRAAGIAPCPCRPPLQLPGKCGDPKTLGCNPGQEQLWVHIPALTLSPFSSLLSRSMDRS